MRPDGTVTFRSIGRGVGTRVPVQVVVSDGTSQVSGELAVSVAAADSTTPISHPVQVTATVGRSVTVDPRRTLSTGAVRPVRISSVQPQPGSTGATASVDPASGRIIVSSSTVGSYYFTFAASTGDRTTTGVLRLDVVAAGERASVVPMVDIALLPEGSGLLLDPLVNDSDPGGRGLAVQRVGVPPGGRGAGLTAAVVDLHQVDLAARSLTAPVTLDYQVWDGVVLAVGQIRVVPVPALSQAPQPLATPIAAVVRAGDVVTIPIAEHATSQDGSALTLSLDDRDLATVPGVLFETATAIRYLAPAEPPAAPVVFGYTVTAATSTAAAPVRAASTVTVTVVPASTTSNHPPAVPAPVTARVFAGGTVDIDLPVHGTDPDGDWVGAGSLVPPEAPLGWAELSGPSSLRYGALDVPGLDQVQYVLADPAGLTATGTVGVLVVPRVEVAGPPVAPDLTATVRPGRTVRIDPLDAVTDPAGSRVRLIDSEITPPEGVTLEMDDDALLLTAPPQETVLSLQYTVLNERGLQATGAIAVTVSESAIDPVPVAGDVVVPPSDLGEGAATVEVSVADRVTNRTGRRSELVLSVHEISAGAARVTAPLTVQVTLTDRRQVLAYQITDAVGGSATALLVVPARDQLVGPQLIGSEIQLNAGTTLDLALVDHVVVADGDPQLADGYPVRITQGSVEPVDARRLRLSAPAAAGGRAVLYLPIRTPGSVPTVLSVPVQIIPRVLPPPEIDGAVLDVEVGTTEQLDLGPLTISFDQQQLDSLTWSAAATGADVTAAVDGSILTVTLAATAGRGTETSVPITVTDGEGRTADAAVTVRATGSRKPLPSVVSQRLDGVLPGQTVTVDLLLGSADPFGLGLTVLEPAVTTGAAGLAAGPTMAGSFVSFTVAQGFSGEIVVGYRVQDGTNDPDRIVSATLVATIADRPSPPGTPVVVEGSRTATGVRLSWAPSDPHGSPLSGYVVTGGGSTTLCAPEGGSCLVEGLAAGVGVVFTVVARNAVGESTPSGPSASVIPDAAPVAPAAPGTTWVSRGVLDVSWTLPTGDFSEVAGVDLQILANGQSQVIAGLPGTSYRATGLDPSTTYTFQVRAVNREGVGEWSASGPAVIPSGTPGAPPVSASYLYDGTTAQVAVAWEQPADTGGQAVVGYRVLIGGQQVGSTDGASRRWQFDVTGTGGRTVEVYARSERGESPAGTADVVLFTRPTPPSSVSATPADGALTLAWGSGSTPGSAVGSYQYQIGGGPWTAAGAGNAVTIGGLANGTAYTVAVRLCNAVGGSTEAATCSDPVSAAPATPFGSLTPPTLSLTAERNKVTASWQWPANGNGRAIESSTATVSGGASENLDAAALSWTREVGWNTEVTVTVRYCVTGGVCTDAVARTVQTAPSWQVNGAGRCGEVSPDHGGPWLRRVDCEAAGGRWHGGGTLEVVACRSGGSYFTDPDAEPSTVVTTQVSTTLTTPVPTTRTDPGPPPTTVTTETLVEIPTVTDVTTTVAVDHPTSTQWYQGADGWFYRTVGFSGAGPC